MSCEITKLICENTKLICEITKLICENTKLICENTKLICENTKLICKNTKLIYENSKYFTKVEVSLLGFHSMRVGSLLITFIMYSVTHARSRNELISQQRRN